MKYKIRYSFLLLFLLTFLFPLKSNAENITVMIDPGHGGDNLGGQYNQFMEKEMTMKTALAMKSRLEKFEGVTVYLTHENTSAPDMSLTERAQFSKSVDADFLFSLHYNKSSDNRLYGCEVWTSAFDQFYVKGTQFGLIEMEALTNYGLYNRGIKTRLNSKGTDYYGIIQHAKEYDIPCVIIEHCHMDDENDIPFLQRENALKIFGELDADSVAKYFHLKSQTLNIDYSSYSLPEIPTPAFVMNPDKTEPEEATITLLETDTEKEEAVISISAKDSESKLLYFDYSFDEGNTYSSLQKWNSDSTNITFRVPLFKNEEKSVIFRVYNQYDKYKITNELVLPIITNENNSFTTNSGESQESLEDFESEIETSTSSKNIQTINMNINSSKPDNTDYTMVIICLFLLFSLLFPVFTMIRFIRISKKRKKRKRKNK